MRDKQNKSTMPSRQYTLYLPVLSDSPLFLYRQLYTSMAYFVVDTTIRLFSFLPLVPLFTWAFFFCCSPFGQVFFFFPYRSCFFFPPFECSLAKHAWVSDPLVINGCADTLRTDHRAAVRAAALARTATAAIVALRRTTTTTPRLRLKSSRTTVVVALTLAGVAPPACRSRRI